ncbi:MAG: hypothetical protein PVI46_10750 [Lysobacterales bacterium]|jgi:hypothetical protein
MNNTRFVITAFLVVTVSGLIAYGSSLQAQQKTARIQRAAVAAPASQELPVSMQRQLEGENARLANPGCGSHCGPGPGAVLKNPSAGGGTRYTCKGSNCACSGACECVAMEEICMPDTVGCSDYGCTCKKKSGAEPEEPNC